MGFMTIAIHSAWHCIGLLTLLVLTAVFPLQVLAGAEHGALNPFAPKPTIVATIKPLALLAKSIAGDDFNIVTLLPPNANPHALALTVADRQLLAEASLVIWLGAGFERFLAKPMQQRSGAQLELGQLDGLTWPTASSVDLHLWLAPSNIERALKAIAVELALIEPLQKVALDKRLALALKSIIQQKSVITRELEQYRDVPFAVSHDGYAHFVSAFGLRQVAAATRLPEEQLSARRMYNLQKSLVGVSCLIVEPNDHSGAKLAKALGLRAVEVDPLGRAADITSIAGLLQSLAMDFKRCFLAPSVKVKH